jgi:hypothetical protein
VSEGAHLRWVMAHPARARQRVRAARVFMSPEAAGAPIYLCLGGDSPAIHLPAPGRLLGARSYVVPCIYSNYYPVDHR